MPLEPYFADLLALPERPAGPAVVIPPGVAVSDISVPGPHGPVPLRIYRPDRETGVALLWAHGGGFRHGDLSMPEAHLVGAELARRAGAYVVSVGYRLADGEVRYPVPIDDVDAAWSWLCGTSAAGTLAIGGASAGAALALATAIRARDTGRRPPDALLLAYPFLHFPNPAPGAETAAVLAALPPAARFTPAGVEEMVRNYVGRISDLPADALPGAARLDGLPPASLLLSEYDDLRPSGELLGRQLAEAGVEVSTFVALGVPHGHLNHVVDLPVMAESLDFFADRLAGKGTSAE